MTTLNELANLVCEGLPKDISREELAKQCRAALEGLFGERYHSRSPHSTRVVLMPSDDNVSFAGFIHPESPSSGAYGGASLIWFPISPDGEDEPALCLPSSAAHVACRLTSRYSGVQGMPATCRPCGGISPSWPSQLGPNMTPQISANTFT